MKNTLIYGDAIWTGVQYSQGIYIKACIIKLWSLLSALWCNLCMLILKSREQQIWVHIYIIEDAVKKLVPGLVSSMSVLACHHCLGIFHTLNMLSDIHQMLIVRTSYLLNEFDFLILFFFHFHFFIYLWNQLQTFYSWRHYKMVFKSHLGSMCLIWMLE